MRSGYLQSLLRWVVPMALLGMCIWLIADSLLGSCKTMECFSTSCWMDTGGDCEETDVSTAGVIYATSGGGTVEETSNTYKKRYRGACTAECSNANDWSAATNCSGREYPWQEDATYKVRYCKQGG